METVRGLGHLGSGGSGNAAAKTLSVLSIRSKDHSLVNHSGTTWSDLRCFYCSALVSSCFIVSMFEIFLLFTIALDFFNGRIYKWIMDWLVVSNIFYFP